jgi:murein DD-endopeptidase MepM/ murein hydrolase activator NlpD
MKRNKLINQSANFDYSNKPQKKHKLRKLPFLAVGGIFLTSIVLATSSPEPVNQSSSQIIELPNLSVEAQASTQRKYSFESQNVALPLKQSTSSKEVDTNTLQALTENTPAPDDIALIEQTAIDQHAISAENEITSSVQQPTIAQPQIDWQEITVKSGDNLSKIFPKAGLTARDVYNITKTEGNIKPLLNLKPGQVLRFGIQTVEDKKQLEQLQLQLSQISTLTVSKTDSGFSANTETREIDIKQTSATGIIESSLFEAGLLAGLSDKLIMELAYIFGWDIDFALDLRQGDSFKIVYQEEFLDGEKIDDGDILAAEFTNSGKTFQAVRFTNSDGDSNYYAPNGDSMRKAFSRTPVHFSRISSRFNPNRKHPVLKGVTRPHRGVDYAAKTGTPIMATGDGKVHFIGSKGGYGRTVILSHGGKYTTLYAHMSRYKKGLKHGLRVKQGQTIGYIGMSGTATGPHLHYEFRVNGVHRNPLTVALPKAQALPKKYHVEFKSQMQPLLAQLDALSDTAVALNN